MPFAMPLLPWIDDEKLYKQIRFLLEKAIAAKGGSKKNFNKNVVDPFSAIFEMAGFGMTHEEWAKLWT